MDVHKDYQIQKQRELEKREKMGASPNIKKKKLKGRHKKAAEAAMEEQWGFYNHHGLRTE